MHSNDRASVYSVEGRSTVSGDAVRFVQKHLRYKNFLPTNNGNQVTGKVADVIRRDRSNTICEYGIRTIRNRTIIWIALNAVGIHFCDQYDRRFDLPVSRMGDSAASSDGSVGGEPGFIAPTWSPDGHRYYNADTGRWLNRDLLEESGGINLYGMLGNDLINNLDWLGLFITSPALRAKLTNLQPVWNSETGWTEATVDAVFKDVKNNLKGGSVELGEAMDDPFFAQAMNFTDGSAGDSAKTLQWIDDRRTAHGVDDFQGNHYDLNARDLQMFREDNFAASDNWIDRDGFWSDIARDGEYGLLGAGSMGNANGIAAENQELSVKGKLPGFSDKVPCKRANIGGDVPGGLPKGSRVVSSGNGWYVRHARYLGEYYMTLSVILEKQQHWREANANAEKAIEIFVEVLGKDHPFIIARANFRDHLKKKAEESGN